VNLFGTVEVRNKGKCKRTHADIHHSINQFFVGFSLFYYEILVNIIKHAPLLTILAHSKLFSHLYKCIFSSLQKCIKILQFRQVSFYLKGANFLLLLKLLINLSSKIEQHEIESSETNDNMLWTYKHFSFYKQRTNHFDI
jgi:hypothetical protein